MQFGSPKFREQKLLLETMRTGHQVPQGHGDEDVFEKGEEVEEGQFDTLQQGKGMQHQQQLPMQQQLHQAQGLLTGEGSGLHPSSFPLMQKSWFDKLLDNVVGMCFYFPFLTCI